jgi:hypothetical protein
LKVEGFYCTTKIFECDLKCVKFVGYSLVGWAEQMQGKKGKSSLLFFFLTKENQVL